MSDCFKNSFKTAALGLLICMLAPVLSGCTVKEKMNSSTVFAMDTVMQLSIEGDDKLLLQAEHEIRNIEDSLSVTKEDSEIGRLNSSKEAVLSERSSEILKQALDICDMTDGSLDVTIYPVLKAWGFTTGEYRVPGDDELEELLANVDYKKIEIAEAGGAGEGSGGAADGDGGPTCKVKIQDGMQVDLGSVVKGYTGSYLANFFKENGVKSGLINLGGNVECIGAKSDGKPWKVAIKSPFPDSKSKILGVLDAKDVSVITSGGYERFFEQGGEVYWHILDPKDGKPAKNGLASVTVVGNNGIVGDGLSTALFVKGTEGAKAFISERGKELTEKYGFGAVLVTEDKKVYITANIASQFSLSSEYSGAEIIVLD